METFPARPRRAAIADVLGRRVTLNSGPEAFHIAGPFQAGTERAPVLVLGTGPEPDALAAELARHTETTAGSIITDSIAAGNTIADSPAAGSPPIFWLDAPRVTAALREALPAFPRVMPPHWQAVSPEEALRLLPQARIYWFRQNCRVDEPFWRDVHGALLALEGGVRRENRQGAEEGTSKRGRETLAAVPASVAAVPASDTAMAATSAEPSPVTAPLCAPRPRSVLLPADAGNLLSRELDAAFRELGFTPLPLPTRPDLPALTALLERTQPALCCSVNLRGFDGEGAVFHLLRACGVPCALWLVDNPWHVLSAVSQPWWRETALFVTDDSFIAPLRQYGGRQVQHLPLAAAQHMWGAHGGTVCPPPAAGRPPLLFVGSSRFAGKDQFFAAARVPEALLHEGQARLRAGGRPDAAWWQAHLRETLWPGHGARRVGLGAETCSQACRAAWLAAAAPLGLDVRGDAGWRTLLPPTVQLLPPVDYYTEVPALYRQAACTLNVTSLLLPHGLTQRHFDVWAAGGVLLTDPTPGLSLFPQELTRPITVEQPAMLAERLSGLLAQRHAAPARLHNLRHAWQEELQARHSYTQRITTLLAAMKNMTE